MKAHMAAPDQITRLLRDLKRAAFRLQCSPPGDHAAWLAWVQVYDDLRSLLSNAGGGGTAGGVLRAQGADADPVDLASVLGQVAQHAGSASRQQEHAAYHVQVAKSVIRKKM
jgi:hypothetical protein